MIQTHFSFSFKLVTIANHSHICNLKPFVIEYANTSCFNHGATNYFENGNHKNGWIWHKSQIHGLLWTQLQFHHVPNWTSWVFWWFCFIWNIIRALWFSFVFFLHLDVLKMNVYLDGTITSKFENGCAMLMDYNLSHVH
jgi:hypothetical protein